jgi:FtsP/CotA-like multicopper oxidase with cupredoxin domain
LRVVTGPALGLAQPRSTCDEVWRLVVTGPPLSIVLPHLQRSVEPGGVALADGIDEPVVGELVPDCVEPHLAPNELVRMYVVNAGPNRISSFHVVGGIFERVFQDGGTTTPLRGVQTVNVPVGGGAIFEVRLREPGDYPFVTHAFADATKGAVGVLRASGGAAARVSSPP